MPSEPAASPPGRRERKKQLTREHIAETARNLFADHGFDRVTIAEIARRADVSEQTVFNHFPTKEDLVYWRMESFEDELLDAIAGREEGTTVLAAFGRFVGQLNGAFASHDRDALERLAALSGVITESPALLRREQSIFTRYTAALAALLAEETGVDEHDVEPWVAASALIGVHRALVDHTRRQVIAGVRPPRINRMFAEQADRALGLLEQGLGRYGVKEARPVSGDT